MRIEWKGYQKRTIRRAHKVDELALLLDPGLGKTSICLQIIKTEVLSGAMKGALIVAPLRPAYMTWPSEIEKWDQFNCLTYTILHSEFGNRDAQLRRKRDIYIINPEGLNWLFSKLNRVNPKDWPFDILVIDESTKFKSMNRKNKRGKFMRSLARGFKKRLILTGTPVANSYRNIQGQWAVLDLGKEFGLKKTLFLKEYFNQVGKKEWDSWEVKPECVDRLERKVAKNSIRLNSADYLTLPEAVFNEIRIKMNPKARKYYKEMHDKMKIEIEKHGAVTALSKSSAHQKCWQIANGCIYVEDAKGMQPGLKRKGNDFYVIHEQKLDALQDLKEELGGKPLLTAYNFKHDLVQLKKRFGKNLTVLEGSMSRCQSIERSWNKGDIEHLAAYPGTSALGLNLQKSGNNICYYSLIYDFEAFDQFIQRVLRQGNDHDQVFIHLLMMANTVDTLSIYPSLIGKERNQTAFLDNVEKLVG